MHRYRIAEQRLSQLLNAREKNLLSGCQIGLEKESLRVSPAGHIAQTPHPKALGSALSHPYITTDYSEALLEFITPPLTDSAEALQFLCDIQKFVYGRINDEFLWATSMPCAITGPQSIPIAQYGRSNIGMMKTVYRRGLGHRYGRMMQVIAGVHFNYSLPDAFWPVYRSLQPAADAGDTLRAFTDDAYFGMIRNLQRFGWLIPYLFGASPAICKSFLAGQPTPIEEFDSGTYYEPFGTSLRMGDIGYQNKQEHECGIKVRYDSLDTYIDSLTRAIQTPCRHYAEIGVVVDDDYRQLNANLLQIENEYYSTVRPKQTPKGNEKPTIALKRRGVQYIELRSLDVNVYDPLGINMDQVRFVEAFMLFCLLHESPVIDDEEAREIDNNQSIAAHLGRKPSLELQRNGTPIALRAWATELCDAMRGVCEFLDSEKASDAGTPGPYVQALEHQQAVAQDPDRTPSARMLEEMRANNESFHVFALRKSQEHLRYYQEATLSEERQKLFEQTGNEALRRQAEIEAADDVPFDVFLERYFAQT